MALYLNHYTDAIALKEIIRDEGIKMWATRFSHLNDSQEYHWSQKFLNPIKEKLCNDLGLTIDSEANTYSYVICFTGVSDELLMWKLYGNQGKGFMLTFDYDIVKKFADTHNPDNSNPDVLQHIFYADNDTWLNQFMSAYNIYCKDRNSNNSVDLDEVCALVKRSIYMHEQETRYMRAGHNDLFQFDPNSGEINEREFQQQVKFRSGEYGLTPYIEIIFPKEALKSITIGYGHNYDAQREAIELLLSTRDYQSVEIKQSNIIQ